VIDKIRSLDEAFADVRSGATILVSGFGEAGVPNLLLNELGRRRLSDLTIVSNNAGSNEAGLGGLLASGCVSRIVCSYPRSRGSTVFETLYRERRIALELVPQGTLAERLRAGGGGIGAFYTPTGAGTRLTEGKETRIIAGRPHVLEFALRGDIALIAADCADRWGNLTYRLAARNFGPVMAAAADLTIAEVNRVVPLGSIDPHLVATPGIFVDCVVKRPST
jgi:3-oxoadipate CoA-transferase, alpha subunit